MAFGFHLESAEFGDITSWDFASDQVTQRVRRIIASNALFIRIRFQDIGRVVRVVLEIRK